MSSQDLSVVEVLKRVDALYDSEQKWTTGQLARDGACCAVTPNNPEAVCYCLDGAVARVRGGSDYPDDADPVVLLLASVAEEIDPGCKGDRTGDTVFLFNDSHDFPAVKSLLARAIAKAESEQS